MFWCISKCTLIKLQRISFFLDKKYTSVFYTKIQNVHMKHNENLYCDYDADQKILQRIQSDEMEDVLNITDEKDFLKIKKKYLKLMKKYHPDTYVNEKNELRRKNKEEIFREIYKRYKAINKENLESYESNFYRIDEFADEVEDEDEKRQRMERYERYAEGKRNDVNSYNSEAYVLISIFVVFIGVFFLCLYLPFNAEVDKEEFYENSEKKKTEIVSCFYNPVLQRYEHFSGNFSPPLPHQLYYFYKTNFPSIPIDEDILKLQYFEIIKLPKNKAKKARLVFDKKQSQLLYMKKKKLNTEDQLLNQRNEQTQEQNIIK